MTNLDEVTWADQTATLLTPQLPLQSLQSAIDLAFTYIAQVGGWVPDDQQNPSGPGVPANHATPTEAAADITAEQISDVYDVNFTVNVTIACQFSQHLGGGLDLASAAQAMASDVSNLITNAVNDSNLPIRVDSTSTQTPQSNRSLIGGTTTSAVRVNIAQDATGNDKIIDYKAAALKQATTVYGLDNTWNVRYIYTEIGTSIVVLIAKYTNSAYTTLDGTSTTTYVYTVSPTTHEIVAGIVLTS